LDSWNLGNNRNTKFKKIFDSDSDEDDEIKDKNIDYTKSKLFRYLKGFFFSFLIFVKVLRETIKNSPITKMETKKATEEVANSGQIYNSVVVNQYKIPIVPQAIVNSAMHKDTHKDESKITYRDLRNFILKAF
jgi:hypothetical protein